MIKINETQKAKIIKFLIEKSSPRTDFFIMVSLAIIMATLGFLLGSEAVIIASMLIAPLLFPILSLSAGLVMSEQYLIRHSTLTLFKSSGLAILMATLITFFFGSDVTLTEVITNRFAPSFLYIFVAITAGFAASYALIKPSANEVLPAVAISVTLIPPLSVMGIGIAKWNWNLFADSLIVFLINLIGIVLANMIVFSLVNLYTKRDAAKQLVQKDQKEILENEN